MGGSWAKAATIWNEGWLSVESGSWNTNKAFGFRVSMDAE